MNSTERRAAISQFLFERVRELVPESEAVLTEETWLTDAGIDSVNLINLIVQIEQQYGVFFEDEEMMSGRFKTIADIAELLKEKLT